MSERTPTIAAGAVTLIQAFLIFAPLTILGAAIDWPASLDLSPAEALPLIASHIDDVRLGYGIYLFYSILWVITGTLVAWLAVRRERAFGPMMMLAVGLACASALARGTGIIRWLTASHELSIANTAQGMAAGPDGAGIEAVQLAVNAWGGAVGEILGVSIFAALWLVIVSVMMITHRSLPKALGYAGFVVAIIVALPAGELFGLNLMDVATAQTSMHVWLMAVGATAIWIGIREK
jgi:Domain of unknown function (DUF4386)